MAAVLKKKVYLSFFHFFTTALEIDNADIIKEQRKK
jgi:hypothetical protein